VRLSLYRRGDVWWVRGSDAGRKFRRSTGQTEKSAAERVRAEWERGTNHAASHKATVESAAERFLEELKSEDVAPGTRDMYTCKAGHVVRLLGNVRLSDLSHSRVLAFAKEREAETAHSHTIHRELTTLRRILSSALRAGEFSKDLKAVMPRYAAGYVPRTRWLTKEELDATMSHLEPGRAAVLAFIVATSARRTEAFSARWADIEPDAIVIRGTKTTKAKRRVPILELFRPYVDFVLEHADGVLTLFTPWGNMRRDILRAAERAGVPPFSANDLRRTTATWLVKRGVPLHLVQRILGHTSIAMLQKVYGQLDTDDVGRLIDERTAVLVPERAQKGHKKGGGRPLST